MGAFQKVNQGLLISPIWKAAIHAKPLPIIAQALAMQKLRLFGPERLQGSSLNINFPFYRKEKSE